MLNTMVSKENVLSGQVSGLLNENHKKDKTIKELRDSKQTLLWKYENCKQLNIDLLSKLDKYRQTLKRAQIDSDRKGKAIAVYVNNINENRQNMSKEKVSLEMQIQNLKHSLKNSQAQIEKLKLDLRFEKHEYQELRQKSLEDKHKLNIESQGLIEAFKQENEKLLTTNKGLKNILTKLNDHRLDEIRTVNEQDQLKHDIKKTRERQFKLTIDSIKNRYLYIRKQNDFRKRETVANKYKTIATKNLYSNAIKKLSKFGVDNNEEVFTAIIQIMEKMRCNANQRILDKSAKTIIEIKRQSKTIQKIKRKIIQQRKDGKINCGFCDSGFSSKGFLANHMVSEHSFSFQESDDEN